MYMIHRRNVTNGITGAGSGWIEAGRASGCMSISLTFATIPVQGTNENPTHSRVTSVLRLFPRVYVNDEVEKEMTIFLFSYFLGEEKEEV